ncbi:hypothetical protein CW360_02865 [Pseudomonas fluvialis]|uniref:DUF3168 domain-containing protein n=1 Tax=Pseudomonas fluvialis TaxID=1793966 RepID=A0A2I0CTH9_9PSED|nr:hypothetical protein [Pseudomonas pharmacofabricae]PKF72673.1 hypothetical protein CW360_02865 [Pseudomonas pharmacofabricae]
MQLIATRITDWLAAQLSQITSLNGYPLALADVHVGRFYEDLPQGAPLPLATVVAASTSDAVTPDGVVLSGRRGRGYQVEVVVNFDQHPGVERHALLDQIEWGIGRAVRQPPPAELRGLLQSVSLGDVQFNYPAPGHSIAIVQAQVATVFIEQYQP